MRLLELYAFKQVGKAYIWGGDDPMKGFDCSGLVIEVLKSCGMLPHKFDTTAQGLYDRFLPIGISSEKTLGSLIFYGKSVKKITHVTLGLDSFRMLEAGGGGSKVLTVADAIKHNAFSRIRPIASRSDLVAVILPKYEHLIK